MAFAGSPCLGFSVSGGCFRHHDVCSYKHFLRSEPLLLRIRRKNMTHNMHCRAALYWWGRGASAKLFGAVRYSSDSGALCSQKFAKSPAQGLPYVSIRINLQCRITNSKCICRELIMCKELKGIDYIHARMCMCRNVQRIMKLAYRIAAQMCGFLMN